MARVQTFVPMRLPTVTHNALMPARRNGKLAIIKTDELRAAEASWEDHLAPHAPQRPLRGPLRADIRFSFLGDGKRANGTPHAEKPDLDNLEKTLWDVLQRLDFIEDDKTVCDKHVGKMWAEFEGVYIELEEIEPQSEVQAWA